MRYYNDKVVERILDNINPRLRPLEADREEHQKWRKRLRIPTGIHAPLAIIGWEIIKKLTHQFWGWNL